MWRIAIICLALVTLVSTRSYSNIDPLIDIHLKPLKSSYDRIREHGYPAESHFVETSDNYVLNVFRIPYSPRLNNEHEKKPIVLLLHGQFSSSDCFLLNGPDNAIAFNFADAGFDVWLGNARGNTYSRNNTRISVNHPYFWDFSWHEIGVMDMPETIDYILKNTGESSLHYVGHSQGTTVYFVMMSVRPEYNAKIRTVHMLAPAIFMGNKTSGLIVALAPYLGTPGTPYYRIFKNQEFLPSSPLISRILDTACGGNPAFPKYCKTLYLLSIGSEDGNTNKTLLPLVAETHPASTSSNQAIHYFQNYGTGLFSYFDHGEKKNLVLYGQAKPEEYPLEKITSAMYIYYGLADTATSFKDVQRLPEYLPNIKLFHEVPDPTWGHMDFISALKVKEVINDKVIQYCIDYEDENST